MNVNLLQDPPDLRQFLDSWPYDPAHNVRFARGANGREIIVVRQPMGIEQYEMEGPEMIRMQAIAQAMSLLENGQYREALLLTRHRIGGIDSHDNQDPSPNELAGALRELVAKTVANRPTVGSWERSLFVRQGDYWTVSYRGQVARLKASRGLQLLCSLLRHPGRERHVGELLGEIATAANVPARSTEKSIGAPSGGTEGSGQMSSPILDAQAKVEYKLRLSELRAELEEAERFNDKERALRLQEEINRIGEQIASAVGLGGRDRKTGSDAERARSAVTKRVKEAIEKIREMIPPLGRHLATHVKTGYFCSYNPDPDHPMVWTF